MVYRYFAPLLCSLALLMGSIASATNAAGVAKYRVPGILLRIDEGVAVVGLPITSKEQKSYEAQGYRRVSHEHELRAGVLFGQYAFKMVPTNGRLERRKFVDQTMQNVWVEFEATRGGPARAVKIEIR